MRPVPFYPRVQEPVHIGQGIVQLEESSKLQLYSQVGYDRILPAIPGTLLNPQPAEPRRRRRKRRAKEMGLPRTLRRFSRELFSSHITRG